VLATFLIIALGKSLAAYLIVRAFGHPNSVALTISASLAQIGEFSFILIVLAVNLAIVPPEARDLVVAGSILSILVNPLMFMVIDKLSTPKDMPAPQPAVPGALVPAPVVEDPSTTLTGHVVLVGHGRVGSAISAALLAKGVPFVVVEEDHATVEDIRAKGIETFVGAFGERSMLDRLNLAGASCVVSAIPDAFEAGHLVEAAKAANPGVRVVARAHSSEAVTYLRNLGADTVLMGEEELAKGMSTAIVQ
jgi:CPA2 family monovalent cation:H+ antiporter-2